MTEKTVQAIADVPESFERVVMDFARKDFHLDGRDRTLGEMLLQLAVQGCECRRLHSER